MLKNNRAGGMTPANNPGSPIAPPAGGGTQLQMRPPITSPGMGMNSFQMRPPITSPPLTSPMTSLTVQPPITSPMLNGGGGGGLTPPSPAPRMGLQNLRTGGSGPVSRGMSLM